MIRYSRLVETLRATSLLCINTSRPDEIVNEIEILIGHINLVLEEQLVDLDQMHPAAAFDFPDLGKNRGAGIPACCEHTCSRSGRPF